MALYNKNFVITVSFVMSMASSAVASLDTTMFEMETKLLANIQATAEKKTEPCEALDFDQDIEYRDCLVDAAMYSLAARQKNDGVASVFKNIFNKIDDALQPGGAMSIAEQAVEGMKSTDNVEKRTTYYEILNNLVDFLSHNKASNAGDFKPVYEFIRNANLEAPEDVVKMRRERMSLKTVDLHAKVDMILSQKISTNAAEVSD